MERFCNFIDALSTWVGKIASFLILVLIAIIMFEVISRYLFNAPTKWVNELSEYLLAGVVMLGGAYCLAEFDHVRVDIFHRNFGPRMKTAVEVFTCLLVLCFVSAMVWKGGEASWSTFIHDTRSMTIMEMPLFPSMVLVPVGALLLGLQSISCALRAILQLTGAARKKEH